MAKLCFRYGTMGSSKTAQALMVRFNYLEGEKTVWLIKPAIDIRDGDLIRSRIGLNAKAKVIGRKQNLFDMYTTEPTDIIIVDEAQFFTKEQIAQLRYIASILNVPVFCYGLRTDFRGNLFEGSKALFELADDIAEIECVCKCGNKATVNARFDKLGRVITEGDTILIGGNDSYKPMCWKCWIEEQKGTDKC